MNPVLAEILETGHVRTTDGETIQLHSHIPPEEGRFLQEIICETKSTVSLEVGLAYGISALFICDALQKKAKTRHIVIDPHQMNGWWNGIGINNLRRAGYEEIIEFYGLPSHLALPQLAAQQIEIDFAFIDGWHTFDHTLIDFFYIDKLLRVGGVVALDDGHYQSIRKLCRFIATNRSYSVLRCLRHDLHRKLSVKRRILRRAGSFSKTVGRLLKSEFLEPDIELGLVPGSRCIAFRKEAHDTRRWDFHREF